MKTTFVLVWIELVRISRTISTQDCQISGMVAPLTSGLASPIRIVMAPLHGPMDRLCHQTHSQIGPPTNPETRRFILFSFVPAFSWKTRFIRHVKTFGLLHVLHCSSIEANETFASSNLLEFLTRGVLDIFAPVKILPWPPPWCETGSKYLQIPYQAAWDCGQVYTGSSKWETDDCFKKQAFFCEIPAGQDVKPVTPVASKSLTRLYRSIVFLVVLHLLKTISCCRPRTRLRPRLEVFQWSLLLLWIWQGADLAGRQTAV